MRHKQVKVSKSTVQSRPRLGASGGEESVFDDESDMDGYNPKSHHDKGSVNYETLSGSSDIKSKQSYFDPPIENYRAQQRIPSNVMSAY